MIKMTMRTCVMGSFMIRTSVTVPNMPKYSLSLSLEVCQLRPPTNSLPGAGSPLLGVLRPEDPEWLPPFMAGTKLLCSSWSKRPLPSRAAPLQERKEICKFFFLLQLIPLVGIIAVAMIGVGGFSIYCSFTRNDVQ